MRRRKRSRLDLEYLTTTQVARALGITKRTLHNKIKAGRVTPPEVNPRNGYFIWTMADLEMARKALEVGL